MIVRQVNGEIVEEPVGLPEMAAYPNEGKTVAAWTLTWGVSIGALLAAVSMPVGLPALLIAGVAVIVLSLAASAILRAVGHGQPRSSEQKEAEAEEAVASQKADGTQRADGTA